VHSFAVLNRLRYICRLQLSVNRNVNIDLDTVAVTRQGSFRCDSCHFNYLYHSRPVLHAEKHHHFHRQITQPFPCSFVAQYLQSCSLTCLQIFAVELCRIEL
jgi:hypothetical protein